VHQDWSSAGFDAPPIAPHVGPFATPAFLSTWSDHFDHVDTTAIVEDERGLVVLCERDGVLEFAGHGDVTDYHTPRGERVADLLGAHMASRAPGTEFRFDSLPVEAADVVQRGVTLGGIEASVVQHDVALVIELGASFDDHLAGMRKKQRHEMRRKRRRFEEGLGAARLERLSGPGAASRFADMHRRASGDKGVFMSDEMEAFFVDLEKHCGGLVDVLLADAGRPLAMSFGFEDDETYYLYNSAFEPAEREHSPGIVLLEMLIRAAIAAGRRRVDLLKGDEEYKYRLGGAPRPLYLVAGTVGGNP